MVCLWGALPARVQSAASLDLSQLEVLDAEEIRELLTGNTVTGAWEGVEYRQYFRADGTTTFLRPDFAQQAHHTTEGKWRIKASHNAYESWWSSSGWSSYTLGRINERLFWLSKAIPPQEFWVLPGKQLEPS